MYKKITGYNFSACILDAERIGRLPARNSCGAAIYAFFSFFYDEPASDGCLRHKERIAQGSATRKNIRNLRGYAEGRSAHGDGEDCLTAVVVACVSVTSSGRRAGGAVVVMRITSVSSAIASVSSSADKGIAGGIWIKYWLCCRGRCAGGINIDLLLRLRIGALGCRTRLPPSPPALWRIIIGSMLLSRKKSLRGELRLHRNGLCRRCGLCGTALSLAKCQVDGLLLLLRLTFFAPTATADANTNQE